MSQYINLNVVYLYGNKIIYYWIFVNNKFRYYTVEKLGKYLFIKLFKLIVYIYNLKCNNKIINTF